MFEQLPDTLANRLISTAEEGFLHGFEISTVLMVGMGGILIVMYLINRAVGR